MPHISSTEIRNETYSKIYKQFIKTLEKSGNKSFVKEFFTETEQIMFAKRLAIVLMLNQEISYITIQKTLNVSPDTIRRYAKLNDRGAFKLSKKIAEDKKLKDEAWLQLEKLLRGGLPRAGNGRWKFLDEVK